MRRRWDLSMLILLHWEESQEVRFRSKEVVEGVLNQ
jgi:hypothetical protein